MAVLRPQHGFAAQDAVASLARIDWTDDVPGVSVRETQIGRRRHAIVEYAAGAARAEWCRDGHAGLVLAGSIEYESRIASIADGHRGRRLTLSTGRAHRGTNRDEGASRLFLIDDPAG